jgi:phenylpropionate dioxygenase-like ring-hydroxylating dioxygenase large terminal subunit
LRLSHAKEKPLQTTMRGVPEATSLGAALDQGATLPATWYTEPAIFAAEQERIFRRCWQYVGLLEQDSQPGDYFTCVVGTVPLIVACDAAGTLRAFVNVCRHRGHQVVTEESGHCTVFQCPYHAWSYNLDGSLRGAPGMRDEPGFDRDQFPLIQAHVDTWGPFVFVNLDPAAPPLSTVLGELPQFVARTGVPLRQIKRRARREYVIEANWKVVVDNYLECYHCPVAHPGFTQLIDLNNYTIREYEYFSTQTGPQKDSEGLYDASGGVTDGFYAFLWPNFTVNIYPGPGNVSLNLFLPLGPGRTRAIYEYCFVDAVGEQEERDFVDFVQQVQMEDIGLCESVQRGLSTGYLPQGKLMLRQERALQHFQRLSHHFLGDNPV